MNWVTVRALFENLPFMLIAWSAIAFVGWRVTAWRRMRRSDAKHK